MKKPTRRFQSGGMTREKNMQAERMMDSGMRKNAQASSRRPNAEQDRIKQMLLREIERRKRGGMGQATAATQKAAQGRMQNDRIDQSMQSAAKKPQAQRGYKAGGMTGSLTPRQKALLMQSMRNRRGR